MLSRILVVCWLLLAVGGVVRAGEVDLSMACPAGAEDDYDAFIRGHAPAEDAFVAVQRIAEPLIWSREWSRAAAVFAKYQDLFPLMHDRFERVKAILAAKEEGLVITNLGRGINTGTPEYNPIVTPDGKTMYFVGKDRRDGAGGEDIYVSAWLDSVWGPGKDIGSNVNTESHEFITAVSADNSRIIFLANYENMNLGAGDLFYVDRMGDGWGPAQHFPPPINTEYFDCDGFVTADGKAMIFTSDRPGGIGEFHAKPVGDRALPFHGEYWGNTDIYVSTLSDSGTWSAPINLGPTINTPYAERTPFLHPDGKTLYFSSSGHGGLGRLDVYKCTRLSDTSWTQWSQPVNLGKEINTPGDDWGYRVSTGGDIAYYAAAGRPDGYGADDIYSVTLPKKVRPMPVATIHGVVTDKEGKPLSATIKWENLETGKNAGTLNSDERDGKYFVVLPLGANYGYYAEKKGYYPVSKSVDLRGATTAVDRTENITLISIEEMKQKETAVVINNIFFEYDKAELKPESFPELDRVAKVLKSNPETRVEISGHTDNMGTDAYNLELSRKRAESVVQYLVQVGMPAAMLDAKGYGKSKPIATNDTEEGRAQNRRVEFKFLK